MGNLRAHLVWNNTGGSSISTLVQQRPLLNDDSGSTPSTFFKEFSAHFKDGDVPSGKIVEWRKSDGTTVIASQGDNRRTWDSGALRTASFTAKFTSSYAAAGADTLKGYSKAGSWNNTNWTTLAAITNLDIRAEITISGTTYTLGANNEITRNTNVMLDRSGPHHAQWRIFGEFRNGTGINSTAEGDVWGIMYLSFFSDGTKEFDCRIFSSRGENATAGAKSVTFYQLKDYTTPTVFFSNSSSFTFYAGNAIDCCDTDGKPGYTGTSVDKVIIGFPDFVLSDPTTTGLYDAYMMWWLKLTASEKSSMVAAPAAITYVPMGMAEITVDIDTTGNNWWIGHMTMRAVTALALKNYASFRQDRINAMADLCNQYWFLSAANSYPYNLNSVSYSGLTQSTSIGWGTAATITINGGAQAHSVAGVTHAGQWAWYQWLSTGKEKWLDHIQGSAIGTVGSRNPASDSYARNPIVNSVQYFACDDLVAARSNAWGGRNRSNAEWATPNAHVMKTYLGDILTNNYNMHAAKLTAPFAPSGSLTLGVYSTGEDDGIGTNVDCVNSPWMHDYWAIVICLDIRRGRLTTSHKLVDLHVKLWIFGRAANGCMYGSPCYNMSLGDNTIEGNKGPRSAGTYPTAWSQVGVGDYTDPWMSMTSTGSNASGQPVINVVTTTVGGRVIEDGMYVTHGTIPAGAKVSSHTATSITLSANLSGTMGNGASVPCYRWTGPITNYDGTGCPASGLNSDDPYVAGHTYPCILHAAAICGEIVGITGASSIRTRFDSEETSAAPTEAQWAAGANWRWRPPA